MRTNSTPSKASQLWKKSLKYRPSKPSKDITTYWNKIWKYQFSKFIVSSYKIQFSRSNKIKCCHYRLSNSSKHSNHLRVRWKLFTDIYLVVKYIYVADPTGPGPCTRFLTGLSALLVMITIPWSLVFCIKVGQQKPNVDKD